MSDTDLNPSELWTALRNSIEDRDMQRLAFLCEKYEESIKAHFVEWQSVPPEVRQDRVQREAYAESLVTLAQVFDRAGKPELLDALQKQDPQNPVDRLDDQLEDAKRLINQKEYSSAIALLESMITEYDNMLGTPVQEGLARIHGLLGVTWALSDELPHAILHTRIALQHCRDLGDQEGIDIYTESLEKMENLLEEG
ncbi:hypothetical protein Pla110_45550 [Polystyrenella longa]|uniref:Tetratricopeptide repeat protein n=1 Tax=Polystyrenella longa TaxID=2528007 RepID=A0A518CU87_9PLAN|nr:hypothetical protein [Polystyrenella longa]QDU82792.1 hypothetical protein Pla110_45550 [Polystyrenella longa]